MHAAPKAVQRPLNLTQTRARRQPRQTATLHDAQGRWLNVRQAHYEQVL